MSSDTVCLSHFQGTIEDHILTINADTYTPLQVPDLIATGKFKHQLYINTNILEVKKVTIIIRQPVKRNETLYCRSGHFLC